VKCTVFRKVSNTSRMRKRRSSSSLSSRVEYPIRETRAVSEPPRTMSGFKAPNLTHCDHSKGRNTMARIKHIALTTKEPAKVAELYKSAFGLKELRRSPNGAVFLTDGNINVAILNPKDEKSPDMGAHGPNFTGIHHFGFEVDDLDEACQKLEGARGQRLTAKDHVDATMAAGGHANFEMKWAGPDGVVIDISHTGWEGTD